MIRFMIRWMGFTIGIGFMTSRIVFTIRYEMFYNRKPTEEKKMGKTQLGE